MADLESRIHDKSAQIGIIGLGYVGLPLAISFAEAGFRTIGFDIQQARVELVNGGSSYIADVSSENILVSLDSGHLEATTDQSRLREVDVVCICVPTPLTKAKEPDLSCVVHESKEISLRLRPGQLIILESTTYPGTTREVVLPILEETGLKVGSDFHLAFSPERVDPGSKEHSIRNTAKLVGGIDERSTRLAELLYRNVADKVVPLASPEVAEMAKLFENVFRIVNIALVNELAQLCDRMGISVWDVIDAASTKPFGFMPFQPGPGVGGHCIPLDPYFLASKARELDFHTRFIELAAHINEHMPYYVATRITDALSSHGKALNGAKVLILGVAYKKDVADMRESPSLKLMQILADKGANISYHDPYISDVPVPQGGQASVELSDKIMGSVDCTVIATDHSCYDLERIIRASSLVFDTRGITRNSGSDKCIRLGE